MAMSGARAGMSLFLRCDGRRAYPSSGNCPWNCARLGRDLVVDLEPGLLGSAVKGKDDSLQGVQRGMRKSIAETLPALP